ncbi:MinD/ParA family protein [Nocardioides gansuensis]|uniref:MinD/ParA family protein n=1 Tax=Nocardioides gansuensis TaxID=2138300 RepID=A0A2T8FAM2_9ACTN|nr:P-loop NTPase [Nocardioides gansuensis]PVG82750.1 MinD/ParA family protein [Nocardioides gansuensis]
MTALVEPDASQLELLHGTLAGSTTFSTMQQVDEHVRAHPHEHAVVVGPSVPTEAATMFAQWARIHRPALGVILLRHRVDSSILAEALRSGMREVVEARDLTGLAQAVQRAHVVAEAMLQSQEGGATDGGPLGSLVTVFSTKGGVGKSFLATNLAAALADRDLKVCLVDLDIHSGDVAIMLQLTPAHHLNDLVAFGGVIDEGAVTSLLTEHSPGLSVIAAPIHIDSPDQASPDAVGKLLDRLKAMFDIVVVDTSGIFDDHALVALDHTDALVLIGTLDIPALKSLKLAAGTLDLLNYPRENWRFVLNRADARVGLTEKEFEDTLGLKSDCRLASSRELLACVNRGEALVRAHPGHPNAKAIAELAASIVTATSGSPKVPEQGSPASRHATPSRRLRFRKVT